MQLSLVWSQRATAPGKIKLFRKGREKLMINDPLLHSFTEEINDEVALQLVETFDKVIHNSNIDSIDAVLQKAISILQEKVDEIA